MAEHGQANDVAPGENVANRTGATVRQRVAVYVYGLALAGLLTVASFAVGATQGLIYGPALPAALIVLGVAQMGVHLVFFLHINTGPDSTNNVMALAFGCIIVALVVVGSLWIMANLDHNMMPMPGDMMNPDLDPRVDALETMAD